MQSIENIFEFSSIIQSLKRVCVSSARRVRAHDAFRGRADDSGRRLRADIATYLPGAPKYCPLRLHFCYC